MILDNKLMKEKDITKMEADAKTVVDDAIEAAMADAEPPLSTLWTDITNDPVGSSTHPI